MAALLIPADSLMRDTAIPQLIDLIHNRLQLINRPHNVRPKKMGIVFHQLRKAIIIRKAHYPADRLAQL